MACDPVEGPNEHAGIFKIAQHGQIGDDPDSQSKSPGPFSLPEMLQQQAEDPVHQDRDNHEDHIDRFSPGIEEEAGQEQQEVGGLHTADSDQQYISQKYYREKNPQKDD